MRGLAVIVVVALGMGLAGCSPPERGPAVPLADTERAQPLGIADARFFPDSAAGAQHFLAIANEALKREIAALPPGAAQRPLPPAHFLAVSGGGDNGAFGAGLLNGWTETGQRPQFNAVTGVSTGALIAPFAFLGPSYDPVLKEVYTTISADRVFRFRGLTAALFDDAMTDTTPLADFIAKFADEKLLEAIAAEYRKGRLLLIGTTNLDAQRPVIWNIGAIAASGHPQALQLVRQILRASSAIPGLFQPVLIDIEIDGRKFQELHVDGGAIAQLFLYPPSIEVRRVARSRERHAWIIRNARLDPDWAKSERRTISIAGRAINTMLAASGQNDILRVYFTTRRDGVDYNLAYIGADFDVPGAGEFNQTYMRALFDYGFQQARLGTEWRKAPPGLEGEVGAKR